MSGMAVQGGPVRRTDHDDGKKHPQQEVRYDEHCSRATMRHELRIASASTSSYALKDAKYTAAKTGSAASCIASRL